MGLDVIWDVYKLMRHAIIIFALCLSLSATTYTIKASGGNYTTISACAAVAVAGDSCVVYASASPQSGWTQSNSGTSGNPITFTANTGDTVNITSTITISSRSYITISGFNLTASSGNAVVGNGTSAHNIITHNTAKTTLFYIQDEQGSNGSDNTISYNTVDLTGHTDNAQGLFVFGDRNLFDHNEIKNGEGDCHDLGGMNVVIRYENCHDMNGASGEHIDFLQVVGGTSPTLSFSLIEHNVFQHCYNDAGNCHLLIIRASGGPIADTVIYRFNYGQNQDGGTVGYGDHNDGTSTVPNGTVYNNTIAAGTLISENGGCYGFDAGTGNGANNICYQQMTGGWSPTIFNYGGSGNGDLAYTTGYSGSWNSPYSTEGTYAALHNQNPLFANYPTDGTLQVGSPAIGAGVALTTAVGSGSGSTSLTVANAHWFQPGWGPTGAAVNADWIRIGTSTTVQISSVDYTNNILTLASPQSWSNGASIYLYKDSGGTVVLTGSAPDVGAFPYSSSPSGNSQASGIGKAQGVIIQ